jgi:hypothetical protein
MARPFKEDAGWLENLSPADLALVTEKRAELEDLTFRASLLRHELASYHKKSVANKMRKSRGKNSGG